MARRKKLENTSLEEQLEYVEQEILQIMLKRNASSATAELLFHF